MSALALILAIGLWYVGEASCIANEKNAVVKIVNEKDGEDQK